ncbi:uncharacterized SAM-binding protein YcdF (DUF218 family) [Mucilaginibacter gracilis]|uniref:Uncharacterized SAM-binding protein YcdF (DUF218 family) n=1 Tax=Mucilaginibacter gracilis TaxID=423350 RepID=A0A495JA99_9SPHI|nr:YdcF family protein [Mucilaginibacter gracilis]RKR84989.1 uncharacterized SAM-binding protein YcdF (DUF218 family) [Mucilaginibacter gracilis]
MFFILSKVLLMLIQPFFWVVVLITWAVITKNIKRKQRLLCSAAIVLYVFSNNFIIGQVARSWDITKQDTVNKTYSCAIILGGFTSADADGGGYFNGSASRYIEAVKLKTIGKAAKILVTGGNGQLVKTTEFKEADYVVQQLRLLKFADSTVLGENQSRNTIENAVFSKKILDDKKVKGPYLLVTSAFHMRRSLYTFKKAGLDVVPYSCDYIAGHDAYSLTDLLPNSGALDVWNKYAKEMFGYVAYHLKKF